MRNCLMVSKEVLDNEGGIKLALTRLVQAINVTTRLDKLASWTYSLNIVA